MRKPSAESKKRSTNRGGSRATKSRKAAIAETLSSIERVEPGTQQAAEAISLFRSWLTDESGYDEKTWPHLKKALDQQRQRIKARRLFGE